MFYRVRYSDCLKFSPLQTTATSTITVTYDITNTNFDRFKSTVGISSGETLKNPVDFTVKVDDVTVATIHCRPKTLSFSWNNTLLITRNYCAYDDCVDHFEECDMPYQPVDILLSTDSKKIELITTAKHSSSNPLDASYNLPASALDGINYATWASPHISSAQRSGEETLTQHTSRIIEQMKSTVTLPSFPWKVFMNVLILVTNSFVRSERAVARTRRGNHTAYLNRTLCDRQASRRGSAPQCL